ncbi:MAG: hypothetical protein C4576_25500 [Desulfobacteraceae bacterium]|nr:MAG: hypothetical protein C4576_25500 [Desulfobacteraceae bacterium]
MITDLLEKRGFTLRKKTADEYSSPCPFCGGEDRFCIWPEKNRAQCIRGCGWKGDDIQLLRDFEHMTFQEAAAAVGRGNNSGSEKARPTMKTDWNSGKLIAQWDYVDEAEKPLYRVMRYEFPDGSKEYPTIPFNGNGELAKGKEAMKGIRRVLYRLPDIAKYGTSPVWICEGEKCADLLHSLDMQPATCNPGGAGKWPKLDREHKISEPLKDRIVYILPDNDEPGRRHAEEVAQALYGKAKEVKILELPGLPEKGDICDFHKAHGMDETIQTLIDLPDKTPAWKPPRNFFSADDLLATSFEHKPSIIGAGIMPHGSHILIAGETGIGKSLLRMELSLHLLMGWDWLGFKVPMARKVGIFQFENSEVMEQTRLKRMCQGLGIEKLPAGRLVYADRKNRINLSLKGERTRLLELVKESEAEVILYDCLSNIHAAKENDNQQMREVLDSLTDVNIKAGTSCIVIHHFGKPGEGMQENRYRTRGASSIMDWGVTSMGFIVKPHETKTLRQLEFYKVRDGKKPKPILLEQDENFLLSIADEGTLCSPVRVREILKGMGGEAERQKVLIEAIMKQVNCSGRSAATYIRRAVEMKEIKEVNPGNGRPKSYVLS